MLILFLSLSITAIIITIALFYVTNKTQSLNEKIIQRLFHLNEFIAAQNTMTALKVNNLNITLPMLRTSWIAYYTYTHDGKGPDQTEINKIRTENDYLQQINPSLQNPEGFKRRLEEPSRNKRKLEYIELGLFIALIITQIFIVFLSRQ